MLKNVLMNALRPGYAKVMLSKVLKRFEKGNVEDVRVWAEKEVKREIQEFCVALDEQLWAEANTESCALSTKARIILNDIPHNLGGGGAHPLLYCLIRWTKPKVVFETGVAAGWSSSVILSALQKNQEGKLFSSDFPYFRISDPEKYVGVLVDDSLKIRWNLDIRGDAIAIPNFLNQIESKPVDFLHFDSDKSYSGRDYVFNALLKKFSDKAILLVDDIQDNFHFRDFVNKHKLKYEVFEFEGKFVGLVLDIGSQLKTV
jgi:hypothetical protein